VYAHFLGVGRGVLQQRLLLAAREVLSMRWLLSLCEEVAAPGLQASTEAESAELVCVVASAVLLRCDIAKAKVLAAHACAFVMAAV
jgi:hypothetical protein